LLAYLYFFGLLRPKASNSRARGRNSTRKRIFIYLPVFLCFLTSQSQANNQREKEQKAKGRVVFYLPTYLHYLASQNQGKEHKGQGKKQHEALGAWGKKEMGEAKVKYLLMSFI
jgi:hypothetical protein